MSFRDHTDALTKHYRITPVDHKIMMKALCEEKVTYLETTERTDRVGCFPCLKELKRRGLLG